jgi:hypothetical protein
MSEEIKLIECKIGSPLYEHAKRELEQVGDIYDGMVNSAALDIVGVFAAQGHSGGSAAITTQLVERLMRYEPLTPLTGEDDEWGEIGSGQFQNKRCSHVFKNADGAFDINTLPNVEGGIGNGLWASISFPYNPEVK